jgi:predicted N-acetyltransferase YhbS
MKNTLDDFELITFDKLLDKKEELFSLIHKSFKYNSQNSFEIDFAPLMNKENSHNCYVLLNKKSQEIIGHIGTSQRTLLLTGNQSTSILLLGGICIHEDYRGKGLFNLMLKNVLSLKEKDHSLIFLWSGDPSIYAKYGFHLCIEQNSYQLNKFKFNEHSYSKSSYSELSMKDKEKLHCLYDELIAKKFQTIQRSELDWQNIARISSTDLYIKKGKDIESYFFINKGEDLTGTIHEIAINDLYSFETPLKDGCLWYPQELENISSEKEFGSIIRIPNLKSFQVLIKKVFGSKMIIQSLDNEKNSIKFKFNDEMFSISIDSFLCGLFGPGKFSEFNNSMEVYISGLDSI